MVLLYGRRKTGLFVAGGVVVCFCFKPDLEVRPLQKHTTPSQPQKYHHFPPAIQRVPPRMAALRLPCGINSSCALCLFR